MFTLATGNPYVLSPALRDAIPVLSRLVRDPDFLDSHVLPLMEEAGKAEDWYVAYRNDVPERSYSLQVFVWPPGTRDPDPRPFLLGSVLLRRGLHPRRSLRACR